MDNITKEEKKELVTILMRRDYSTAYYSKMLPEIEKLTPTQVQAMCGDYWNQSTAEVRKKIIECWANHLEGIGFYERGTVNMTEKNMTAISVSMYERLGKLGTYEGLSGKLLKESVQWWLSIGDYVLSTGHMQYLSESNLDINDWRNR
jgi:hypothetical protein